MQTVLDTRGVPYTVSEPDNLLEFTGVMDRFLASKMDTMDQLDLLVEKKRHAHGDLPARLYAENG